MIHACINYMYHHTYIAVQYSSRRRISKLHINNKLPQPYPTPQPPRPFDTAGAGADGTWTISTIHNSQLSDVAEQSCVHPVRGIAACIGQASAQHRRAQQT